MSTEAKVKTQSGTKKMLQGSQASIVVEMLEQQGVAVCASCQSQLVAQVWPALDTVAPANMSRR